MLYDKIKDACISKGISIRELEIKAKIGNGTIGRWNVSSPTLKSLVSVAKILECNVEDLLEEK